MRILVVGATGFIGRDLCAHLVASTHEVTGWVRHLDRARELLPKSVALRSGTGEGPEAFAPALSGQEAVVNLTGEPLFARRWNAARKLRFESSRIGVAKNIALAMLAMPTPPTVFISASAIGYYGDRGAELLPESSPPGTDYAARLAAGWEAAAMQAAGPSTRVATPRIGLVLGTGGGLLGQMLPAFRLGLGGNLGHGDQFMSWIHQADLNRLIETMLTDSRYAGPVNAVAPNPVTNREFTKTLARRLGRPAFLPVPKSALRLGLGEAAEAVLASQRVTPKGPLELGFEFKHPTLDEALASLGFGS